MLAAIPLASQRNVLFDMEKIATDCGTVISASLFGALAGSGALPFPADAFEQAIRVGGKGVEPSLKAFALAFAAAGLNAPSPVAAPLPKLEPRPKGDAALVSVWQSLAAEAAAFPDPVREMALLGLRKVVDFQDVAYGREYLDRLRVVLNADAAAKDWLLTREAAKHIANAFAYDDVIRVADLKTRAGRFARVHAEMGATEATRLKITEFMHPRAEEIVGLLPAAMGRRIEAKPSRMKLIDWLFNKGRHVRTDSLWSFLTLYTLAGLRFWRRRTLRHAVEQKHLDVWLATALSHVPANYDLAVEIIRTRRLIKGYSCTHSRGLSKFDRVMQGVNLVSTRDDAADWARRLREAALLDEDGLALDGAIATIRSFTR